MIQYLVLKSVVLEVDGRIVKNLHENGSIFVSYFDKEEAIKASENGKYSIHELEVSKE